MSDAWLRSVLYKKLYWRLSAETATESLIADTISASSTAAGKVFAYYNINLTSLGK